MECPDLCCNEPCDGLKEDGSSCWCLDFKDRSGNGCVFCEKYSDNTAACYSCIENANDIIPESEQPSCKWCGKCKWCQGI